MELQKFIMYCLRACTKAENNKEIWMHQAFGAVQFYIIENPDDYAEVAQMWEEMKPHFERQIWHLTFTL